MKEDILEQLVDDYLKHKGYFTQHNVKFKPAPTHPDYQKKADNQVSDIDVLAYHPRKSGPEKVLAVTCKSWQKGFNPPHIINAIEQNKKISNREAWKFFRELARAKWSQAFIEKVYEATGQRTFTYVTAVTRLNGDKQPWEAHAPFKQALGGADIKILTLSEMLDDLHNHIGETLEPSAVGRLLQVVKASGWRNK